MKVGTYEYLEDVFCVMYYSSYNNIYKMHFCRGDTCNSEMIINFYVVAGTDEIDILTTNSPRYKSLELYQEVSSWIKLLKLDVIKEKCRKPSFKFMELFK